MKNIIEICCCSVDDAINAELGGADRIELNSALELGGLTPSLGELIETKKRVKIPVIVMIRPRTGGFCYTRNEIETMKNDAKVLIENGADGIAIGVLTKDNKVDVNCLSDFAKIVDKKELVFHRAIDVCENMEFAVQQIISLNFTRILTSGGKKKCFDGINMINNLDERFGNKIQFLACGGIRPTNINEIIEKIHCNQFHMSLTKEVLDFPMKETEISFNGTSSENTFKTIDILQVKEAVRISNK